MPDTDTTGAEQRRLTEAGPWRRWGPYHRMVYKYPQQPFPYDDLLTVNRSRDRGALEYELLDTGIFAEDRYFDVIAEYAKASPEDLLLRITVHNRGPEAATLRSPAAIPLG